MIITLTHFIWPITKPFVSQATVGVWRDIKIYDTIVQRVSISLPLFQT